MICICQRCQLTPLFKWPTKMFVAHFQIFQTTLGAFPNPTQNCFDFFTVDLLLCPWTDKTEENEPMFQSFLLLFFPNKLAAGAGVREASEAVMAASPPVTASHSCPTSHSWQALLSLSQCRRQPLLYQALFWASLLLIFLIGALYAMVDQ